MHTADQRIGLAVTASFLSIPTWRQTDQGTAWTSVHQPPDRVSNLPQSARTGDYRYCLSGPV